MSLLLIGAALADDCLVVATGAAGGQKEATALHLPAGDQSVQAPLAAVGLGVRVERMQDRNPQAKVVIRGADGTGLGVVTVSEVGQRPSTTRAARA